MTIKPQKVKILELVTVPIPEGILVLGRGSDQEMYVWSSPHGIWYAHRNDDYMERRKDVQ